MKILVIDDEKPTLSMFKLFLTAFGYDVYTAENGESGLALVGEIFPDIVFTDIKMPGIDGIEVLRRIRKMNSTAQVIIITGHGDMEIALEALDLDASDFINKPVERQALNSALAKAEKRAGLNRKPGFSCRFTFNGSSASIWFKGKLSKSGELDISRMMASDFWQSAQQAVFYFDTLFSIDRSGITLFMDVVQTLKEKQIQVTLKGLSYNYIRFFQMAGIDKLAEIESDAASDVQD